MIVEKVINNNVISAYDHENREVVVMGKGIGFQKKPGQYVQEDKIEKVYILDDGEELESFTEFIKLIPTKHLRVSLDIIDYAKMVLPNKLSSSIYLSLTDHINFALKRLKEGLTFQNPLYEEVKSFYPEEYLVGEYGVALIERNIGVILPVDEAASLALHFVNAEYNIKMNATMHSAMLIKDVLAIIEKELGITLNTEDEYYSRFMTHLKFMAQRIFMGRAFHKQEPEFSDMIAGLYAEEYRISGKISEHIKTQYNYTIPSEEMAYLTIHIRRIQPQKN